MLNSIRLGPDQAHPQHQAGPKALQTNAQCSAVFYAFAASQTSAGLRSLAEYQPSWRSRSIPSSCGVHTTFLPLMELVRPRILNGLNFIL